ncbi:MAG: hypothetical protein OXG24_09840 [Gammaproteobacteria bacterium]|nr:hypothetical protein [Gammaproteobacteria bacterium]
MTDLEKSASSKLNLEQFMSKLRTATSHIPRLFVELSVVFIGVYLAFLLTDYQEELEKRDIRIKFYESLIVELSSVVKHLDEESGNMLWHLSAVEEIVKGNRPKIPARPLHYSIPGLVLSAAFDSRNFESLNTDTINNIVILTPAMESLKRKIDTFNDLLVSLLAAQQSNENCCYNARSQLLDDYAWYPKLVVEMHELDLQIRRTIIESAIPDLQKLKES